jgi:hypothetical protein
LFDIYSYFQHSGVINVDDQGLDGRSLLRTKIKNLTNLTFSFASATNANELVDYQSLCLEQGSYFQATYADTNSSETSRNAFAVAVSEESLWLNAICTAYASAYARICAFTKVDGAIQVEVNKNVATSLTYVSLNVALSMATTTFAMTKSIAVANAYTNVTAKSFTSVTTFCQQVRNKSPLCSGGTASTDLQQLAIARASSLGQAGSVAASGTYTNSTASVELEGTSVFSINSFLGAYAKNWVFSEASTAVNVFASAFSNSSSTSFLTLCIEKYGETCSDPANMGEGFCNLSAEEACANAEAKGETLAEALSLACSRAFINAQTTTEATFVLSANVDCKNKPFLTWKCADGYFRFGRKGTRKNISYIKRKNCQKKNC